MTDITDDLINDGILDAGELEHRYFTANADAIPYIIGHYGEGGEGEDEFLFDMEWNGFDSAVFEHPQTGERSFIRSSEWFADIDNIDTTNLLFESAVSRSSSVVNGSVWCYGSSCFNGIWWILVI